jgi:hypothetical protein
VCFTANGQDALGGAPLFGRFRLVVFQNGVPNTLSQRFFQRFFLGKNSYRFHGPG